MSQAGVRLRNSTVEKDLVILGMSQRCVLATKAKRLLGCTNRSTVRRLRGMIISLSSLPLRLHLESCAQFWGTPVKNVLINWVNVAEGYQERLREVVLLSFEGT